MIRRSIVAGALALAAATAGCAVGERPTLVEGGQGAASLPGIDNATPGSTDLGSDPAGGEGEAIAMGTDNDLGAGPTGTLPAPADTFPAPGGMTAAITPTGVLVEVVAAYDAGLVVTTPCGETTTVTGATAVGPVDVVLDPGHGGDERGAVASTGLTEADLNLRVARQAAAELTDRGWSVVLTRDGDHRVPISRRAALADAVAPEVLVSIHHNTPASAPSPKPGTEVYVQSTSDDARRLGGLLYEEVVDELSVYDVEWSARSDAGVLVVLDDGGEDAYGIARYPTTPAALVELAYLGNDKEVALLETDEYPVAAGRALADGIERYLTTADPGSGFQPTPRTYNPQSETGGTTGCVDPALQ